MKKHVNSNFVFIKLICMYVCIICHNIYKYLRIFKYKNRCNTMLTVKNIINTLIKMEGIVFKSQGDRIPWLNLSLNYSEIFMDFRLKHSSTVLTFIAFHWLVTSEI